MKIHHAARLALLAPLLALAQPAAAPQDFYGTMDCTLGDRRHASIEIGEELGDGATGTITHPGEVALAWNDSKTVKTHWGRAQAQGDGSVRLSFDKRKPVVLRMLRAKPTEEHDRQAFFTLREEGGKLYRCGHAAK